MEDPYWRTGTGAAGSTIAPGTARPSCRRLETTGGGTLWSLLPQPASSASPGGFAWIWLGLDLVLPWEPVGAVHCLPSHPSFHALR